MDLKVEEIMVELLGMVGGTENETQGVGTQVIGVGLWVVFRVSQLDLNASQKSTGPLLADVYMVRFVMSSGVTVSCLS